MIFVEAFNFTSIDAVDSQRYLESSISLISAVTHVRTGNSMHVLLAGDNGMMYVWGALKRMSVEETVCHRVPCVGVVELPTQVSWSNLLNQILKQNTQINTQIFSDSNALNYSQALSDQILLNLYT